MSGTLGKEAIDVVLLRRGLGGLLRSGSGEALADSERKAGVLEAQPIVSSRTPGENLESSKVGIYKRTSTAGTSKDARPITRQTASQDSRGQS